jgi:hypothetical protein
MPHKPVILNVSRIRHTIKLQKGKAPKKEDIPAVLSKRLGVEVPIYFNKNNKIRVETYDASDGLACCMAGVLLYLKENEKKP